MELDKSQKSKFAENLYNKAVKLRSENKLLSDYYYLKAYKTDPSVDDYRLSLIAGILIAQKADDSTEIKKALYAFQSVLENSHTQAFKDYAKKEIAELNAINTQVDSDSHLITSVSITYPKQGFENAVIPQELKTTYEKFIIKPILHKDKYREYGIDSIKIMLYGAPGVGKTYTAKLIAAEAKVGFIYVNISEVFGMYAGTSEKNLVKIFREAKKAAPVILFFDEFDALGRSRSGNEAQGEGEIQQRLVNQLLLLIGNPEYNDIYLLTATNYPWLIDPALRRNGRIGRLIYIPLPSFIERKSLFEFYAQKGKSNINPKALAKKTDGYTPADIKEIMNTATMEKLSKGDYTNLTTQDVITTIKKDFKTDSASPFFERASRELHFKVKGRHKILWSSESPIDTEERNYYIPFLRDIIKYKHKKNLFVRLIPW